MGIIHLLRDAIETEVDNVDLEDDIAVTQADSIILEYPEIVLPWLWRASHYGIQSDFARSSVISSPKTRFDLDIIMAAIPLPPCS
jgi:hypothetical protein